MHKMLVSHECPIQLLEASLVFNDFQYCLVHLMEENEQYRDWYLNVSSRFGQEVLLDNSIFELGESFDGEKYVHWINLINPNYYIVPDMLENCRGTIDKWKNFTSTYGNRINEHGHSKTSILKIGVVQGKTWSELVECYKFMSDAADYLAISFDYSYYTVTGYGDTKLEKFCNGRQRLIKQLIDEGIWNWRKPHHLLGCSLAKEFSYYVNNNIHNIRSCDTSNPVVAGIHGIRYNGDLGLTMKPPAKLADLIKTNLSQDMVDDISYNTKQFKRILMREQ